MASEKRETEPGRRLSEYTWLIGVAAFFLVFFLMRDADAQQRAVGSIFAACVALWITEAVPLAVTALLGTTLLVLLGVSDARAAFSAFGDPIILLFLGSFILAKSMEDSGLDRRLAYGLLSKRWATKNMSSTLLALGSISCLISLFVSNTATTAMMLPIGLTMLRSINADRRGEPVAVSYLLMLTWGSSIAVGTIIGTPPNVLGAGLIEKATGVEISFVDWAVFAMPITIVLLAIAWLVLRRVKTDQTAGTASASEIARQELERLGPLSAAERNTMVAFSVALFLWLAPGILQYAFGTDAPWVKELSGRVPESVAALVGAFLLFILPCSGVPGNRAMTWRSASQIGWGTILLFGGGIALGDAVFKSGLAEGVGNSLAQTFGANETWAIAALSCALAILLSELASNTAAATTAVPVAISLAQGAGVSPIPAALAATIGSNLGFMLPISTPPNAIVHSTGLVPTSRMMRTGLLFDVVGFAVTMGALYLILPAMGWDRPLR